LLWAVPKAAAALSSGIGAGDAAKGAWVDLIGRYVLSSHGGGAVVAEMGIRCTSQCSDAVPSAALWS